MLQFYLETTLIKADIKCNDKYVLINGFSGEGKSLFVSEIDRVKDTGWGIDKLYSSHEFMIISKKEELNDIYNNYNKGIRLFISDEFYGYRLISAVSGLDAYVIVVTRKIYSNINMSYRCLYHAVRHANDITIIERIYKVLKIGLMHKCDCILIEDSGSGKTLIEKFYPNCKVVSAYGKSNIAKKLIELKEYKSIFIIFDGGGCADVIKNILRSIRYLRNKGIEVRILIPECFEHILLASKFIGVNDILDKFDLKYDNTERYCEFLIEELSKDKPYEYSHDKQILSKCWIEDCSDECKDCNCKLEGFKKELVLKDGPAWPLLYIE